MSNWQFKPTIFITLTTLVLLTLFLSLSYWQFSKAREKAKVTNTHHEIFNTYLGRTYLENPSDTATHIPLEQVLNQIQTGPTENFKQLAAFNDLPAWVQGRWIPDLFFYHDNRIYKSQVGYHVLAILKIHNTRLNSNKITTPKQINCVLVNLGWVGLVNQRRTPLPNIELKTPAEAYPDSALNALNIYGQLQIPLPNKGFFSMTSEQNILLGTDRTAAKQAWLLQKTDIEQVNQILNRQYKSPDEKLRLAPVVIRASMANLITPSSEPLIQDWQSIQSIGLSKEKHQGYALQWLTFALILTFLYIKLNLKSKLTSVSRNEN